MDRVKRPWIQGPCHQLFPSVWLSQSSRTSEPPTPRRPRPPETPQTPDSQPSVPDASVARPPHLPPAAPPRRDRGTSRPNTSISATPCNAAKRAKPTPSRTSRSPSIIVSPIEVAGVHLFAEVHHTLARLARAAHSPAQASHCSTAVRSLDPLRPVRAHGRALPVQRPTTHCSASKANCAGMPALASHAQEASLPVKASPSSTPRTARTRAAAKPLHRPLIQLAGKIVVRFIHAAVFHPSEQWRLRLDDQAIQAQMLRLQCDRPASACLPTCRRPDAADQT